MSVRRPTGDLFLAIEDLVGERFEGGALLALGQDLKGIAGERRMARGELGGAVDAGRSGDELAGLYATASQPGLLRLEGRTHGVDVSLVLKLASDECPQLWEFLPRVQRRRGREAELEVGAVRGLAEHRGRRGKVEHVVDQLCR